MNSSKLDRSQTSAPEAIQRRNATASEAGLLAAPVLLEGASNTIAAEADNSTQSSSISTRAFGVSDASGSFGPITIKRRPIGPHDVLLDVLYCGICHSDVHQVRNEWSTWNPTQYPCVPGHEIIGRVRAVGKSVTKFRVGDIGGVGCMVDSCGTCQNCLDDREQNCAKRATFTYNSPVPDDGYTFGGYSNEMVVLERFVIRIPPSVDLAAMAPLLCAGITTFSPMQYWKLSSGQRVGVIGLGGLGHMAVKLAASRSAKVTAFTTSPGKLADAKRLGAREVVLSSNVEAMKQVANRFDLIISTVPRAFPMQPFVNALKEGGTFVNVGAMEELQGVTGIDLIYSRKSIAGSMIGGIAETQEVIDYCAARKITADIELIGPGEINKAYDRVVNKDVRYRFVIDMSKK